MKVTLVKWEEDEWLIIRITKDDEIGNYQCVVLDKMVSRNVGLRELYKYRKGKKSEC